MVTSGINDYEIYDDSSNDKIIVRFPWKSDEKEYNAAEAVEEIAATALFLLSEEAGYITKQVISVNGGME